ncbi:MAG: ATP-dependent helicase HrpB [Gammaproteobacteria bacterium]|nr:ATP-dependent helicase HrpB [Gammaproteobacteria bacterium]
MLNLPVTQVIPDIQQALLAHHRLVLQAPPGAGKTTAVPISLLDQPWLANKKIIMLEPRRLAARNAASRMAFLLGEEVGNTVGYMIRADRCFGRQTRILVVTEGILTRLLQSDPELADVALVIFDEFHERNLHADLSLAFCLQSQELLRPDLKVLIMSATLNTEAIAGLLEQAPVIISEGRSYPVQNIYLPSSAVMPDRCKLADSVMQLLARVITEEQGNVLVFLPGVREIKQVETKLQGWLSEQKQHQVMIAPLYGDLTKAQQDRAILPCESGNRKIVLATNIAETSLTIEGITVVIDSGLQRESRFNPGSGMNRIETVFISQDSADQRSGRAGRLSAGKCYRLWTESQHKKMARHNSAEILISDLAPLVLELANWGVTDVKELHWLDVPNEGSVAQARELLHELEAINEDGRISTHGKQLLDVGAHPRLAHMMVMAAQYGHAYDACLLAALLTERDIFRGDASRATDMQKRLDLLRNLKNTAINDGAVDKWQCQLVTKTADQFYQKIKQLNKKSTDTLTTGVMLAFAYPDRIAQSRHTKDHRYLLSNGKGAILDQYDELVGAEYIVVADLDGAQREARIFRAADIALQQLEDYFSEHIEKVSHVIWNAQIQRVEASKVIKLGALILEERVDESATQESIHRALLEGVKQTGLSCLPWSKEALAFKQRIQFINIQKQSNPALAHMLAQLDLPDMDDDYLLQHLDEWLLPHLTGQNSIKKLQSLNLLNILSAGIPWQQQKLLDELAPTHISVPSGSRIAIDYSDPQVPVLAVRLQELFGQKQTPAIMNGQFNLLIHLLSPGYQPMQVTQDLASFWKNAYFEVKKELCGKYKKHYWPDDPLTAQATSKTKRFMDKT